MRPALLLLVWICAYAAYQNGWLDVCAKPMKIRDKIGSEPGNLYKAGFYTISEQMCISAGNTKPQCLTPNCFQSLNHTKSLMKSCKFFNSKMSATGFTRFHAAIKDRSVENPARTFMPPTAPAKKDQLQEYEGVVTQLAAKTFHPGKSTEIENSFDGSMVPMEKDGEKIPFCESSTCCTVLFLLALVAQYSLLLLCWIVGFRLLSSDENDDNIEDIDVDAVEIEEIISV